MLYLAESSYAMDNREVPVVEMINGMEVKIAAFHEATYKIDVVVHNHIMECYCQDSEIQQLVGMYNLTCPMQQSQLMELR